MIPTHRAVTRDAYDAVADLYAAMFTGSLTEQPWDRALIGAFAEVAAASGGPVADLGCGPGHVTAHLAALGLDAFGVDLSPAMIAHARRDHPDLRFTPGSFTALDVPDASLGGILSRYSLIHTPPDEVPAVLAEFHRVLAPGAPLLVAFQSGDGLAPVPYDHRVAPAYVWPPDAFSALLTDARLPEFARFVRAAEETERTAHTALVCRRPPA